MANLIESETVDSKVAVPQSLAKLIGTVVFYSLLVLIVLVAIPYGTAEPWWKSLFQCGVFVLTGLCVIERLLWPGTIPYPRALVIPLAGLLVFAFIQTLSWTTTSIAGVDNVATTPSADAYQTRLFISQLLALLLAGVLIVLHTTTRRGVRTLVDLVIALGVASACFGLLRQTLQSEPGFVLPYLLPGFGYAQFINRNHFGFLVEMGLGLALGTVVCRGVGKARMAAYLAAAAPMWISLIWSVSRAAIVSALCQILFLAFVGATNWKSRRRRSKTKRSGIHDGKVLAAKAVLIFALFAGAVVTVLLVGGEPLNKRLGLIPVEFNTKTADAYVLRINIWQATLDLIKDHPIAGVGFGAYWIAVSKYHHATGELTPQDAHSDYLEVLACGGVIGLLLGLWLLVVLLKMSTRKLKVTDRFGRAITFGALAGIIPVAIHSLVESGLHITINALVFTVLISLIVIDVREEGAGEDETVNGSRRSSQTYLPRRDRNSRLAMTATLALLIIMFPQLTFMSSTDPSPTTTRADAEPAMAVLTVRNGRTITVNGIVVGSGATILNGNTLETSRTVTALINVPSLGQIEISPDSRATVGFGRSSLSAVLLKGCINLEANKGTSAQIHSTQGVVRNIDAATGGTMGYCVNDAVAASKPEQPVQHDFFGLGESAIQSVIGGRRRDESLTQGRRGNNPAPSAP